MQIRVNIMNILLRSSCHISSWLLLQEMTVKRLQFTMVPLVVHGTNNRSETSHLIKLVCREGPSYVDSDLFKHLFVERCIVVIRGIQSTCLH